ncbi:MAG TPA: hypothetical protein VH878_08230 [Thermodesulfobacteriota bacterium]
MNRRKFLALFVGLTITGIALLFVLRNKARDFGKFIVRFTNPQLDKDFPTGVLSDEEMRTIIALSEALIPTVEKPRANDEFIRDQINQKTKNVKGLLREYRNAVNLLNEASKKVNGSDRIFSELSLSERDDVLGSILWRYRSDEVVKRVLERIFVSRKKIAFRDFVIKSILVTFFRVSPATEWAIVGYSSYPGVPAEDPREYTRPPETSSQETNVNE